MELPAGPAPSPASCVLLVGRVLDLESDDEPYIFPAPVNWSCDVDGPAELSMSSYVLKPPVWWCW